jgi:hypothetical protein
MDSWEYDIEEVLGEDGATVGSLIVRFTLPDDVTSAAGLELLCQPEEALSDGTTAEGGVDGDCPPASGYALVIKSADSRGAHIPEPTRTDALAACLVCRAPHGRQTRTSRRCSRCDGFLTCCLFLLRGDASGMPRGAAV